MTARLVAWLALAVAGCAMSGSLILWITGVNQPFTADIALYPVAYLSFAAVGALIIGRQPTNRIGQLSLGTGLLGSSVSLADSYARLSAPMVGQDWAAWVTAWAFPASFGPIVAILLLFPTGRFASGRWAALGTITGVGVGLVAIGSALTPAFADFPDRANPIGQAWITGTPIDQGGVGWLLLLLGTVTAAAGLVIRLRRSRGVERQQLKLVALAAMSNGLSWMMVAFDLPGAAGHIATYAVFATFAAVPIAIGVAMLRYRLYDFDQIVRRTLVYGAVTVLLGAAYAGGVLALQAAFSPLTQNNSLAIALSTLGVAALFVPVRRRVQHVIDRRFYRSRYDAQRTLEAFAARLRNEVDLDHLTDALRAASHSTVRPRSASVWLRGRAP